ncbi:MAG: TonB-dependent receptor plug domain-containing protein [Gemmatimonadetes bacterium]|nr:TonB-dependent receptor plug domain-containing protein [Gemmatimonadota bacterium]
MTVTALATTLVSWLLVASVTSALLALAAYGAQQLLRRRVPARIVWSSALLGAALVSGALLVRRDAAPTGPLQPPVDLRDLAPSTITAPAPSFARALMTMVDDMTGRLTGRLTAASARVAADVASLPQGVQWSLVVVWPATSLMLLSVLVVGYRRQQRLAAHLPTRIVDGTPVQLTESLGPMVVGVDAPRILVPRWLADRDDVSRTLAVRHERAHVEAGDPALLLAGCGLVALMPWNLPAWAMLSRLRLAIELDCDARVLASESSPRRYAELLLAAARPGDTGALHDQRALRPALLPSLVSPSLFPGSPSQLERRLRAMTARPPRFTAARGATALVLAGALVAVACRAELPTAAEVERMDVATTERKLAPVLKADSIVYFVNNKPMLREQAIALNGDSIATVNIRRLSDKVNEVRIQTKGSVEERAVLERELPSKVAFRAVPDSSVAKGNGVLVQGLRLVPSKDDSVRIRMRSPSAGAVMEVPRADPLYIVDGVKRSPRALQEIPVSSIVSVEVVKGDKAQALYGSEGANGVIVVTTRK